MIGQTISHYHVVEKLGGGDMGIFGTWSGPALDDSRLFLRGLSTQDVYALDVDLP